MELSKVEETAGGVDYTERIYGNECRVCLKRCTETCQIFHNGGDIPLKLMAIAPVQVEEGDGLPTFICLPCYQRLDISYDFKQQVQRSDEKLRQITRLECHGKNSNGIVPEEVPSLIPREKITDDFDVQLTHDVVPIESDQAAVQSVLEFQVENFAKDESTFVSEMQTISNGQSNTEERFSDKAQAPEYTEDEPTCHDYGENLHPEAERNKPRRESSVGTESKIIKQEELSLQDGSELSVNEDGPNRAVNTGDVFKVEIKNDVHSEDNENNAFSEDAGATRDNTEERAGSNCSDDEEKPLICRTSRQKCPHCIKSFATRLALQRHMAVHERKTKLRYICYICDKQFSNVPKLKSHVVNSHNTNETDDTPAKAIPKTYERDCQERRISKTTSTVEKSCNNSLDGPKSEKRNFKYTCKVCSKQFTYQKPFLAHAKSHPEYKSKSSKSKNPAVLKENESEEEEDADDDEDEEDDDDDSDLPIESLQCTQCGKLFATKRNLKRHISTHSGLKFNCSTCGKAFSRVDKLKDHEQSKHKEEAFGNSDDDDAENDTDNENRINDNSERRKKDRHNRPHKCTVCPKAFAQPQSLANHMERHKRVKDTQKRFLCEVCSKCFAQSGSLVAHMRTHTGVKPYVCNVCSRAFTKSTYLQLHLRTHSGEKPYICQYCSRAFARANTLARHITMHTGEAKYHCQICTKSFRRLTSLNEHTYTHTGQRPYACKICTKRYNNAGSLYAHTKKCKAQQLSGSTTAFTVTMENQVQQNRPMPQVLIYSQRKLMEDATVGQVTPTPQYMIANVHNQKTLPTNIVQPFAVEEPNVYTVNAKQFKNPYYTIYPNM